MDIKHCNVDKHNICPKLECATVPRLRSFLLYRGSGCKARLMRGRGRGLPTGMVVGDAVTCWKGFWSVTLGTM
jgi:hypothetical protein